MREMTNHVKYIVLRTLVFIEPTKNNNQGYLDVRMCLLPNVGYHI